MLIEYPFVRVEEVWFNRRADLPSADIARYRQVSSADGLSSQSQQTTLLLDLLVPQDALLKGVEKDTRYDIRRAERGGVEVQFFPTSATDARVLEDLCSFYAQFSAQKSLPKMNRRRLEAARRENRLWLSMARDAAREVLVWHVYILVSGRARLLHSASLYRALADRSLRTLVGRANRYLHWQDISALKRIGQAVYDFGGWYDRKDDPELLRVNRFKEEFGGKRVVEFNGYRFLTLRGRALGLTLRLKELVAAKLRCPAEPRLGCTTSQTRVGPPGLKGQASI